MNVSHDEMGDESIEEEDEHGDDDNGDGAPDNDDFCFEDIVVLDGDPLVSLLRAITLTLSILTQNNDCENNLKNKKICS